MQRLRLSILAERERDWARRQIAIRDQRRCRKISAVPKTPEALVAADGGEDPERGTDDELTDAAVATGVVLSYKCTNCGVAWGDLTGSRGDECTCGETGIRLKAA